jgi:hypothetical protein
VIRICISASVAEGAAKLNQARYAFIMWTSFQASHVWIVTEASHVARRLPMCATEISKLDWLEYILRGIDSLLIYIYLRGASSPGFRDRERFPYLFGNRRGPKGDPCGSKNSALWH